MNWLVKIGGVSFELELPDALPGAEAEPLPDGRRLAWHARQRTLILTAANGVEHNLRVRSAALSRWAGEAATELSVELLASAAQGIVSLTATVELAAPGQSSRGKTEAVKAVQIRSQITGKVLKVLVGVGDHVAQGDPLMIVEAMKMENRVFAPQAGTVTQIAVKDGDAVQTGRELLRLAKD